MVDIKQQIIDEFNRRFPCARATHVDNVGYNDNAWGVRSDHVVGYCDTLEELLAAVQALPLPTEVADGDADWLDKWARDGIVICDGQYGSHRSPHPPNVQEKLASFAARLRTLQAAVEAGDELVRIVENYRAMVDKMIQMNLERSLDHRIDVEIRDRMSALNAGWSEDKQRADAALAAYRKARSTP